MAQRLDAALTGREVTRMEIRRDVHLRPRRGAVVSSVQPVGKHLLVRFDDGTVLHTHMRMDGGWHVYRPGVRWRRPAFQARVIIEVEGAQAVCFDAPVVEVTRGDPPVLALLGPDLMVADADLSRVDPSASVSETLLDQRVAAGIGNEWRCEILWVLGLHPATPSGQTDVAKMFGTAAKMLRTMKRPNMVYGRWNQPCRRCGASIQRGRHAGRVSYWCPGCQP